MTVTVRPATVSVPVREAVPELAATAYTAVPLPVAKPPEVIVNHETLLVDVQLQPAAVVTVELWVLASAVGVTVVGETVNVQDAVPCWTTVTVWPATVSVPVRDEVPVLAAMEKATVPLPLPVTPDVMLSQETLLVAVHEQPVAVVTLALLEPATAAGFSEVGETVKEQDGAAPAWVTVTVWPAMVSVPVRDDVAVLAAMANATAPLPLPPAPDVMVIQEALLVAVQPQPPPVVTVLLLELAGAPGVSEVGDTVNVQGADPAA